MKNFKFKPIDLDHLMKMSLANSNIQRWKKQENRQALLEYGFSNTGELMEIKERKVEPLGRGVINLVRQLLV